MGMYLKEAFKEVVSKKRIPEAILSMGIIVLFLIVCFWGSISELPGQVALAIVASFSVIIFVMTAATAIIVMAFVIKKKYV